MEWLDDRHFKLECEGSWMIALCLKCYFVDEKGSEKKKFPGLFLCEFGVHL